MINSKGPRACHEKRKITVIVGHLEQMFTLETIFPKLLSSQGSMWSINVKYPYLIIDTMKQNEIFDTWNTQDSDTKLVQKASVFITSKGLSYQCFQSAKVGQISIYLITFTSISMKKKTDLKRYLQQITESLLEVFLEIIHWNNMNWPCSFLKMWNFPIGSKYFLTKLSLIEARKMQNFQVLANKIWFLRMFLQGSCKKCIILKRFLQWICCLARILQDPCKFYTIGQLG